MTSNDFPMWTQEQPLPPDHTQGEADATAYYAPTLVAVKTPQKQFPQPGPRRKHLSRHLLLLAALLSLLAVVSGEFASTHHGAILHLLTPPPSPPIVAIGTPALATPVALTPVPSPTQQPLPLFPLLLPSQWFFGHSIADAASVSVIAQDFVLRYQSADGTTLSALQAAQTSPTNFLTRNARLRYLGQVPGIPPDPHMTVTFTQQFVTASPTHTGISSEQAILDGLPQIQPKSAGTFFALVTVPYQQLTTSNGTTQVRQQTMTLALVAVAKNGLGIPNLLGWGVAAYSNGTSIPLLPDRP